ncbi:MAG TPA: polysaccharide deacetylase family protein [Cyclobacteriaceae bacterium]|nr:polysaccharide deacetylase family protein [Cyclobacteriaceae bacterium]
MIHVRIKNMSCKLIQIVLLASLVVTFGCEHKPYKTEITKWQNGKKAAVSLTFDDGYITQFTEALPIMNRLSMPATFFIITGQIPGSQYEGKFIGRPVREIIRETATITTNKDNFFERASAIGYLGYQGTLEYHANAGGVYDESNGSKAEDAYKIIDEGFAKIRTGHFKPKPIQDDRSGVTWDEIKTYAGQGHEFASHTVTHPRLAVLDEVNLLYELEKSKEEILNHLGPKYTFSAECPYGTENERVMQYAYKIYPALRNRMPEPFLEELNRSSQMDPGTSKKEYVQWQRGATTKTPLPLMKSWVDTVATHDNNWLVLVFHGVDGIGYEALSHELLDEYFQYIKDRNQDLWITTFADATKYMRERMGTDVNLVETDGSLNITLTNMLDKTMYSLPLTLKSYVPDDWESVNVRQSGNEKTIQSQKDEAGSYVIYQALPDGEVIELSEK